MSSQKMARARGAPRRPSCGALWDATLAALAMLLMACGGAETRGGVGTSGAAAGGSSAGGAGGAGYLLDTDLFTWHEAGAPHDEAAWAARVWRPLAIFAAQ